MRHHDARAPFHERGERILHERFAFRIERTRRLIEHEHGTIGQNGTRNGDALALAARKLHAAFSRLDAMRRYCETDTCRRGLILDYFGDEHDEYCDNCGNCTYVADCDQPTAKRTKTTGTTASRNLNFEEIDATITEFVYDRERMLGFGYGIRKTIRSLMGDTGEGVDDRDIDQLDGYGALTDVDEDVIADRIHRLIDNGTIYVGNYHTLLEP